MSRLRSGELLAGAGAVLLAVALFLGWFDGRSAWSSLGWLALFLAIVSIGVGGWLVAVTATGRPVALQVQAGVVASAVTPLVLLVLLIRVLFLAPSDVGAGAWLGLLGALLVAVGAWRAIGDERTGAPESAYAPPAPRPAPPVRERPS
jgi:hypothetical protein